MQSEQINELAAALAKAQGAMGNAAMNRINPHFKSKYADMSSVLDAIRAPLSANGLSIVQPMQATERGLILRTVLMHSSGQYIASEYPLPAAQNQQAMGSALTYARRYSIAAMVCNSADEDDDGRIDAAAGSFISPEQVAGLASLADKVGADKEAFWAYLGVSSFAAIKDKDFQRAVDALKKKGAQ